MNFVEKFIYQRVLTFDWVKVNENGVSLLLTVEKIAVVPCIAIFVDWNS